MDGKLGSINWSIHGTDPFSRRRQSKDEGTMLRRGRPRAATPAHPYGGSATADLALVILSTLMVKHKNGLTLKLTNIWNHGEDYMYTKKPAQKLIPFT
jgi:hypothetical protein